MKVCWFSAGVSSFISAYLAKPDKIIYIDIDDQHTDSMRFVMECEERLKKKIEILKSPYGSVEAVARKFGCVSTIYGAPCTGVLKRRVRKEWEKAQSTPLVHVWGMDCGERGRAAALTELMPEAAHEYPLIDNMLTKADAHAICSSLGVKRPVMYDMGYSNNNCIGCVKGGMGYWNKIRVDFPSVFDGRARLERDIGNSCINGVFLDELDPSAGRMGEEVMPECSIFCEIVSRQADQAGR